MTNIFETLSNPDRVAIINHLATNPDGANGRQIADVLDLPERRVSSYLMQLSDAGLIDRKRGKTTHAMNVRNKLTKGIVWPLGLSLDACRALSVPARCAIMDHLADDGPMSVSMIVNRLKLPQDYVSKHLRALRTAGLVTSKRDKQAVMNSIADGVEWPVAVRRT